MALFACKSFKMPCSSRQRSRRPTAIGVQAKPGKAEVEKTQLEIPPVVREILVVGSTVGSLLITFNQLLLVPQQQLVQLQFQQQSQLVQQQFQQQQSALTRIEGKLDAYVPIVNNLNGEVTSNNKVLEKLENAILGKALSAPATVTPSPPSSAPTPPSQG